MTERHRVTPYQLPALLAEVARATSTDAAIALARAFGGTALYIPREIDGRHPVARAVGLKNARVIAARWGGERPDIPMARSFLRWLDARRLRDKGKSTAAIARALVLTQRHVGQLLEGYQGAVEPRAQPLEAPTICGACGRPHRTRAAAKRCDARQIDLFDDP
jgi:hypothetical protein